MKQERFAFALERLDEKSWSDFERLSSTFLASDYPDLRTVGRPSGDEGRDAELFSPESDPSVLIQYSVTKDWVKKIRATAERVAAKKPFQLMYVSSREIGADADDLKREIFKNYRFRLDVRDRHWFVERVNTTREREEAGEALARKHVDSYLADREIFSSKAPALEGREAKAAFTYLGLQWEDDTQDKGLTKLAFEALAGSVLHGTDSEHRLPRADILARVRALLPSHDASEVDRHTISALSRLTKRRIRHWKQQDEFCLTYEEILRVNVRLIEREQQETSFLAELRSAICAIQADAKSDVLLPIARRILERFLYERGEEFAAAAASGEYKSLDFERLDTLLVDEAKAVRAVRSKRAAAACVGAVRHVLEAPGEGVQSYLRTLADSYTLFAFLRETPDIQAVVAKMFSYGDIWLDASTVLPALAETLFDADDRERRVITRLLKSATTAGLKLHVTDGILEEIERHINRAASCARSTTTTWRGSIPFLYSAYVAQGKEPSSFNGWLATFRGDSRPVDDVADYLRNFFDIRRTSLTDLVAKSPERFRQRVLAMWQKAHDQRRDGTDQIAANRLAAHDAENYIGIIERRRTEREDPFGFNSWLLTLDRRAYGIDKSIRNEFRETLGSPLMTPDFLSNYLSFGPIRRRVPKDVERNLPVVIDTSIVASLPKEIIEVAAEARKEAAGLPDYRVQRAVRDRVEEAKRRRGRLAEGGLGAVAEKLTGRKAPHRRRPRFRRSSP